MLSGFALQCQKARQQMYFYKQSWFKNASCLVFPSTTPAPALFAPPYSPLLLLPPSLAPSTASALVSLVENVNVAATTGIAMPLLANINLASLLLLWVYLLAWNCTGLVCGLQSRINNVKTKLLAVIF
jgi:hypothetical protein